MLYNKVYRLPLHTKAGRWWQGVNGMILYYIREEDKVLRIGYSVCSPNDKFNQETGLLIALGRTLTEIRSVPHDTRKEFYEIVEGIQQCSLPYDSCNVIL